MQKLTGIVALIMVLGLSGGFPLTAAQQADTPLPRVASASVPLYPRVAAAGRVQGLVTLRVSTDGERVSAVSAESGPPFLVQVTKENVKTWRFEPHVPTIFEVRFNYKLSTQYTCDPGCKNCRSVERESVLLQLPTDVELKATIPMICDPAVVVDQNK